MLRERWSRDEFQYPLRVNSLSSVDGININGWQPCFSTLYGSIA